MQVINNQKVSGFLGLASYTSYNNIIDNANNDFFDNNTKRSNTNSFENTNHLDNNENTKNIDDIYKINIIDNYNNINIKVDWV